MLFFVVSRTSYGIEVMQGRDCLQLICDSHTDQSIFEKI